MTPSQKPEWIELAVKKTSSFPRTISRGLPVIALVVSTSILGVGAHFAHSAEESPVKAVEFSTPADMATPNISLAQTALSTTSSIENPSTGTLPTGRGEMTVVLRTMIAMTMTMIAKTTNP